MIAIPKTAANTVAQLWLALRNLFPRRSWEPARRAELLHVIRKLRLRSLFLVSPKRTNLRTARKTGSQKAPQVLQLLQLRISRLDQQLQSELDVAPLVYRTGFITIDATLLGLDIVLLVSEGRRIQVKSGDVQVVVIEDVVELATELHGEALRELEVLVEVHVHVPIAGPNISIAAGVRQTTDAVGATVVDEPGAVGQPERVTHVNHRTVRVAGQVDVVKQVRGYCAQVRALPRCRFAGNPQGPGDSVEVGAVVNTERQTRMRCEDGANRPASERLARHCIAGVLHPRKLPYAAQNEPIRYVVIGVSVAQLGVEGVEISQVIDARLAPVEFSESRRQVVQGVRPGIIRRQIQPLVQQVGAGPPDVDGVVVVIAVVAAEIHVAVLIVEAVIAPCETLTLGTVGLSIAQVLVASADLGIRVPLRGVDVGDVIAMDTMGPCIVHRNHRVPHDLALDGDVPSVGVGGRNVLVDGTLADGWQGLGSVPPQRAEVVGVHRLVREINTGGEADHTIVRRILDGIERHVAEVTLVADAITAANTGGAVAEYIIGKTNTRTEVVLIRFPEHAALGSKFDRAITNLVKLCRPWTEDEVGVEGLVRIVLHAVVLPAQAKVQRQAWRDFPRILGIERPVIVNVVAAKRR